MEIADILVINKEIARHSEHGGSAQQPGMAIPQRQP